MVQQWSLQHGSGSNSVINMMGWEGVKDNSRRSAGTADDRTRTGCVMLAPSCFTIPNVAPVDYRIKLFRRYRFCGTATLDEQSISGVL